ILHTSPLSPYTTLFRSTRSLAMFFHVTNAAPHTPARNGFPAPRRRNAGDIARATVRSRSEPRAGPARSNRVFSPASPFASADSRSEEHTSELQSPYDLV